MAPICRIRSLVGLSGSRSRDSVSCSFTKKMYPFLRRHGIKPGENTVVYSTYGGLLGGS